MTDSDIIEAIVSLIKPLCPLIYFGKSKPNYPKINGDLRRMTVSADKNTYRLVLDYFRDDGNMQSTYAMAEAVESALSYLQGGIESGFISIYHDGARNVVSEQDDKITHITEAYQINCIKNRED